MKPKEPLQVESLTEDRGCDREEDAVLLSEDADIKELLSEEKLAYQYDEQKVYILSESDIGKLTTTLSTVDRIMGFSQSKTWDRSDKETEEQPQDVMLKEIAKGVSSIASTSLSAVAANGVDKVLSEENLACQSDTEEVYVLSNLADVEGLVRNLSSSGATGYSQSRFWNRTSVGDGEKIEEILQEILVHITQIEEQLKRMEGFLK